MKIRFRRLRFVGLLLVLGLVAAACSDDDSGSSADLNEWLGETTTTTSVVPVVDSAILDEPGEWTVLVYLAADNDLEPFALEDLAEMEQATGVQFVVLVDRHPEYTDEPLGDLGDFDDTRLLRIVDGTVEVIDEPGELDTGDPAVLADFVAEGLTDYASERNALVIWNHGAAWHGAAVDESSGGSLLGLSDITSAVAEGLDRSGVDRLDLIGFDACLMATYEVAASLAPVSRTLLASEELEPGHGWDWSAVSAPGGTASVVELGQSIADGFLAQSVVDRTSGITLSLVDLDHIETIDAAFGSLETAIGADAAGLVGRVGAYRGRTLGFGRDPDPRYDYQMVDLGHLAGLIGQIDGLSTEAGQLRAAIDEAVLVNVVDDSMASATGLAAYFPPLQELGRPGYELLDSIEPWVGFLRAYYVGAESIPTEALPWFLDEDRYLEDDEVDYTDDHLGLAAEVAAGTGINIASAKVFWGQVDMDSDNLVLFFGEAPASIAGDTVSAEYDWRYLVISDGQDESSAYSQLIWGSDGSIQRIVVPITYSRGRESVRGSLVLGVSGGDVSSQTFFLYGSAGNVAEIQHRDGDTFTPLMLMQDLSDFGTDWIDASSVPLWADAEALTYSFRRLEPFTPVMVEIAITDINGDQDFVFHGTASP